MRGRGGAGIRPIMRDTSGHATDDPQKEELAKMGIVMGG